ncbi:hypothetical protein [Nocardia brasiliensis]|uniref:hypothetical protein n=1 Tax=Nocardia brasiliensis TaxID=37326 RepID=UPI003D8FC87D
MAMSDEVREAVRTRQQQEQAAKAQAAQAKTDQEQRLRRLWADTARAIDATAPQFTKLCREFGCNPDYRRGFRRGWVFDLRGDGGRVTILVLRRGSWRRIIGVKDDSMSSRGVRFYQGTEFLDLTAALSIPEIEASVAPQIEARAAHTPYSWTIPDPSI